MSDTNLRTGCIDNLSGPSAERDLSHVGPDFQGL